MDIVKDKFSILKTYAQKNLRDAYITDLKYRTVWTNNETPLTKVLFGASKPEFVGEREQYIMCADGTLLKVNPIFVDDVCEGYFFEHFSSNELAVILSKTKVFYRLIDHYNSFRSSISDILLSLEKSGGCIDLESLKKRKRKISADNANLAAFLEILSPYRKSENFDAYMPLLGFSKIFKNLSESVTSDIHFKIQTKLNEGLFIKTSRPAFEYAVLNLLINAIKYCDVEEKIITLSAYYITNFVCIEISDNGTKSNLRKIKSYCTIFQSDSDNDSCSADSEDMGIAIAALFAKTYNGKLKFMKSETGGLCVTLEIPFHQPRGDFELRSAKYYERYANRCEVLSQIMGKVFSEDAVKDINFNSF